ncbi:hypothetical protein TNCV_5122931 [Trichonephila clavipes]|nr:hypothetical protein TNCV_5122931 [Trichonephila clavipes]
MGERMIRLLQPLLETSKQHLETAQQTNVPFGNAKFESGDENLTNEGRSKVGNNCGQQIPPSNSRANSRQYC